MRCSRYTLDMPTSHPTEIAVFGGGCFWCTEAIFKSLKGVDSVTPGYAGGSTPDPTYEQVSSGSTGHAEVVKIEFNPDLIAYAELLTVFFATHNPTMANRQGDDVGEQYRSVILTTEGDQAQAAEDMIRRFNETEQFGKPVLTQVMPLGHFYEAEAYHHDYFEKNPHKPYCQVVISPKLKKLHEEFSAILKKSAQ